MSTFQFRITSTSQFGKTYQISDESTETYGRASSCDHQITDSYVSKCQFEVSPKTEPDQNPADPFHQIVDLNSQHGTRVNGIPIQTATLCQGDIVQVGTTKMVYENSKQGNYLIRLFQNLKMQPSTFVFNMKLPIISVRQNVLVSQTNYCWTGNSWSATGLE